MPGAGRTHGPPATKKQAAVTTGSAGTPGIPRAMVLTAASRSPRCAGLVGHRVRHALTHIAQDLSGGRPGPRDLTVRISVVRRREATHAATSTRPPHPASTFVTTAKRPSDRDGTALDNHDFGKKEREIFLPGGLDRAMCLNRRAK